MTKFTYIAKGDTPPVKTNVLGVDFDINVPKEVTDPEVIAKLEGHPCFIEGAPEEGSIPAPAPTPDETEIAPAAATPTPQAAPIAASAAVPAPAATPAPQPVPAPKAIGYNAMVSALAAADVKPKSRSKEDVAAAYEGLAA